MGKKSKSANSFQCFVCQESNLDRNDYNICEHDSLKVTMCDSCNEPHSSDGKWHSTKEWKERDDKGKCIYCEICGEGGTLLPCDDCSFSYSQWSEKGQNRHFWSKWHLLVVFCIIDPKTPWGFGGQENPKKTAQIRPFLAFFDQKSRFLAFYFDQKWPFSTTVALYQQMFVELARRKSSKRPSRRWKHPFQVFRLRFWIKPC